jgi:hypothetical protein
LLAADGNGANAINPNTSANCSLFVSILFQFFFQLQMFAVVSLVIMVPAMENLEFGRVIMYCTSKVVRI